MFCIYSRNQSLWSIYISQLIQYPRACGSYQEFVDRELLLTRKMLNQDWLSLSHHFKSFMVGTWLTITEYLCNK